MMLFETYAGEEEVEAVREVIERGTWWLNGEEVRELENKIRNFSNRHYAVSFNSGTSALFIGLVANGITGDVILPAFTYPATANAVYAAGADPVFADIERQTLGLDVNDVNEKITQRTGAIVPVHYAGGICRDIEEIVELANDHGIRVIEDSAQSLGASWNGVPAGGFGHGAMFSFSYNKIISTGAGGMFVTDNEHVANRARQYSKQGKKEDGSFDRYGYNLVLPSINAAIGVAQMKRMNDMIKERINLAYEYDSVIEKLDWADPAPTVEDQRNVFQMYNIICNTEECREKLQSHLDNKKIPSRVSYPPVIDLPFYTFDNLETRLPVTRDISKRILTIPFHLNLTKDDIDKLLTTLKRFSPS